MVSKPPKESAVTLMSSGECESLIIMVYVFLTERQIILPALTLVVMLVW